MTQKAQNSAPPPRFTLADLAGRIGGRAEGDADSVIADAAGIDEAGPADVTFIDGARRLAEAAAGCAGAVILPEGLDLPGRNLIRAANPRLAFAAALALLHPAARPPAGVHPSAIVAPDASVAPDATVSAFCWVGPGARVGARSVLLPFAYLGAGATLGEDVLLHPRATVLDGVRVGDRVILHSGAVLGSDGFGYVHDGRCHRKVPQVGTVEVGDDVEIGAGTTVDRATTGSTRIGTGTKIDNLVQIGHNVRVGEHAILVAQVGMAGSSAVGAGAVLGGQVGVADHAVIGAGARVGARGGVMSRVEAGAVVSGYGPQPHGDFLRSQAVFEQLPALRRRVIDLEKRLTAAEARLDREASGRR